MQFGLHQKEMNNCQIKSTVDIIKGKVIPHLIVWGAAIGNQSIKMLYLRLNFNI
jgi:hypothetical protein